MYSAEQLPLPLEDPGSRPVVGKAYKNRRSKNGPEVAHKKKQTKGSITGNTKLLRNHVQRLFEPTYLGNILHHG